MQAKTSTRKVTPFLAIITLYLIACSGAGVSPIVYKLSEAFPEIPMVTIRMITTINALINCIVGLATASILGKKLKYNTILRLGAVLFLIGSIMPMFLNQSFWLLLLARAIWGIGSGCFACRDVVMAKLFPGPSAAKLLGYGAAVTTACNTIAGLVAGVLGDMDWHKAYYLGFIAIIPSLIVFIWSFEPDAEPIPANVPSEAKPKTKGKVRPVIWFYFIRMVLLTLCSYPVLGFISVFVAERGLGGATEASWVSSAYTLGLTAANLVFGYCHTKLGRVWLGTACTIGAVSFVCILASQNTILLAVLGGFLLGISFSGCMMSHIRFAQEASTKDTMAFCSTLLALAVSVGSFLSSYWMVLCQKLGQIIPILNTETEKTFLIGIVVFAAFGLHALIRDPRPTPAEQA